MEDSTHRASQKSSDFPDSFHRVVIKGLYVENGKLLLQHDFFIKDREPIWELPGGGLDFGETFREALVREVREETGLSVTAMDDKPTYMWTNKRENSRGMDWFYVLIMAFRFQIKDFSVFTPTDECRDFAFFSKEELQSLPNLAPQLRPLVELFDPADFA